MVSYLIHGAGKTLIVNLVTKCGNCENLESRGFNGKCGGACTFDPAKAIRKKLIEYFGPGDLQNGLVLHITEINPSSPIQEIPPAGDSSEIKNVLNRIEIAVGWIDTIDELGESPRRRAAGLLRMSIVALFDLSNTLLNFLNHTCMIV